MSDKTKLRAALTSMLRQAAEKPQATFPTVILARGQFDEVMRLIRHEHKYLVAAAECQRPHLPDEAFTRVAGKPLFYATKDGIATVREMLTRDWTADALRGLVEDLLRTLEGVDAHRPPTVQNAADLPEWERALLQPCGCDTCTPLTSEEN